jgi:hypothetical protein
MKRAVTVKGAQAARSYAAAPVPIPSGANQRAGVAAEGQKWIVLTADASNGTAKDLDMQQITGHAHPHEVEYCK